MDSNTDRTQLQAWKTVASRELYVDLPWVRLVVEKVHLSNGRTIDNFYQVDLPQYVVVVALNSIGEVVVEKQYKHAIRGFSLVLPSGYLQAGEEPLVGAQRELLEETGYIADEWQSLGSFIVDGNRGCGRAHLFVARQAQKKNGQNPDRLEDLEVFLMSPVDLRRAIRRGEMVLLASVAAAEMAFNLSWHSGE